LAGEKRQLLSEKGEMRKNHFSVRGGEEKKAHFGFVRGAEIIFTKFQNTKIFIRKNL